MKGTWLAIVMVLNLGFGTVAEAQTCTVNFELFNRDREVNGDVNKECAPGPHSTPWGNWGVNSNWGSRVDGHQFQGWCHNHRMPNGDIECKKWFEWNSCTRDHIRNDGVSCYYYNVDRDGITGCEVQATKGGSRNNSYGSGYSVQTVQCPMDTNDDGVFDSGGCLDVSIVSVGGSYMDLYELDMLERDDFVSRLHFPSLSVKPKNCTWNKCPSTDPQTWKAQTLVSPGGSGAKAKIGLGVKGAYYSFDCNKCEALPNNPCCAACGNN